MKVLFDHGVPAPLRNSLPSHEIKTAYECGWTTLANGALLLAAEAEGFVAFITTDQNLQHQQNLKQRALAVIVLSTTNWHRIQPSAKLIVDALDSAVPGAFIQVSIP